ncbi:hypothetical protein J6590_066220 [Homalodisca vitripennis]|nr:hypothetical protein J6590_066220 [Homalodisca vitripennis]
MTCRKSLKSVIHAYLKIFIKIETRSNSERAVLSLSSFYIPSGCCDLYKTTISQHSTLTALPQHNEHTSTTADVQSMELSLIEILVQIDICCILSTSETHRLQQSSPDIHRSPPVPK